MALNKVDISLLEDIPAPGAAGKVLSSDGTNWVNADGASLPATGADGNVLTSDGTNWATEPPAVDTTKIDQSIATLGLHIGVADNKASYNLPAAFIDTFEDDSGILTETTVDRLTDEYVASTYTSYGASTVMDHDTLTGDQIYFHGTGINSHNVGQWYNLNQAQFANSHDNHFYNTPVGNLGAQTWYWSSPSTSTTPGSSTGWVVDYGASQRFINFKIHRNTCAGEVMSFRLQYSADNSNWTNFDLTGSTFAASPELTSAGHPDNVWANSTKDANGVFSTSTAGSSTQMAGSIWTPANAINARYIRFEILTWANRGNANVGWGQFIPTIQSATTASNATGTLISKASTADAAVSSISGVMLYEDAEGTGTLGTDLKIFFSSNDGTNWTEAASYGAATTFIGTTKMVKLGKTTISNTGTAIKIKAEWANQAAGSKVQRLHGWAVNY